MATVYTDPNLRPCYLHNEARCTECATRRRERNASAVWWLARGLRRLAGFDRGGN